MRTIIITRNSDTVVFRLRCTDSTALNPFISLRGCRKVDSKSTLMYNYYNIVFKSEMIHKGTMFHSVYIYKSP